MSQLLTELLEQVADDATVAWSDPTAGWASGDGTVATDDTGAPIADPAASDITEETEPGAEFGVSNEDLTSVTTDDGSTQEEVAAEDDTIQLEGDQASDDQQASADQQMDDENAATAANEDQPEEAMSAEDEDEQGDNAQADDAYDDEDMDDDIV